MISMLREQLMQRPGGSPKMLSYEKWQKFDMTEQSTRQQGKKRAWGGRWRTIMSGLIEILHRS